MLQLMHEPTSTKYCTRWFVHKLRHLPPVASEKERVASRVRDRTFSFRVSEVLGWFPALSQHVFLLSLFFFFCFFWLLLLELRKVRQGAILSFAIEV